MARGIFVRPKVLPYVGKVNPGVNEVVHVIEQTTGATIAPHGAEAVRQLGLSTQMQMQAVFYTTGNSRKVKLGNIVIRLKHVTLATIEHLHKVLPEEAFERVMGAITIMPAWMVNMFYLYKQEKYGH